MTTVVVALAASLVTTRAMADVRVKVKSRRQDGIHFPDADLQGRALGTSVGRNAWTKATTYFTGTAAASTGSG